MWFRHQVLRAHGMTNSQLSCFCQIYLNFDLTVCEGRCKDIHKTELKIHLVHCINPDLQCPLETAGSHIHVIYNTAMINECQMHLVFYDMHPFDLTAVVIQVVFFFQPGSRITSGKVCCNSLARQQAQQSKLCPFIAQRLRNL